MYIHVDRCVPFDFRYITSHILDANISSHSGQGTDRKKSHNNFGSLMCCTYISGVGIEVRIEELPNVEKATISLEF